MTCRVFRKGYNDIQRKDNMNSHDIIKTVIQYAVLIEAQIELHQARIDELSKELSRLY